jgi:hypothetical protein
LIVSRITPKTLRRFWQCTKGRKRRSNLRLALNNVIILPPLSSQQMASLGRNQRSSSRSCLPSSQKSGRNPTLKYAASSMPGWAWPSSKQPTSAWEVPEFRPVKWAPVDRSGKTKQASACSNDGPPHSIHTDPKQPKLVSIPTVQYVQPLTPST